MNDEQQAWDTAVRAVANVLSARLDGATPPPVNTPTVAAAELVVYLLANYFNNQNDLIDYVMGLSESSLEQTISNPLPKRK